MNLYKIKNEYLTVFENSFDESGEVNIEELERLNKLGEEFTAKGLAVASFIKNIEAEKNAITEAKKQMQSREIALSKKIEFFREYLKENMTACSIEKISCPYFEIKIKKCPAAVFIEDENLIDDKYKKVKITFDFDKISIKNDINNGINVVGASLINNSRIEIK